MSFSRRDILTGVGFACSAAALRAQTRPSSAELLVTASGAKGDGKTLDTAAINRAIEAAASRGGGLVRFPAGTYLCHSIRLKSRVSLYLDPGATILAADFPAPGVLRRLRRR